MKQTKYEILKVDYESKTEEIKKNYRKLVKILHPDSNKNNTDTEEQFKELTAAFETLRDETKREKYDLTLTTEDKKRIREKYLQYQKKEVIIDKNQEVTINKNRIEKQTPMNQRNGIIRIFYNQMISYKCQENNKHLEHILNNFNTGKQIICIHDCYNQNFTKNLFSKNYLLPEFNYFIPLQKNDYGIITSRLIWYKENIYIWRKNGVYHKLGPYEDFIVENCFLYHKKSKKSYFYECFTGNLFEITGFLNFATEYNEGLMSQKKNQKKLLLKKQKNYIKEQK